MVGVAAGIAAVGSVASGVIQGNAARDAANAQAQSARDASRAQQAQFERQVQLQEPFRQGGLTALQQYMVLLGLSPNTVYGNGEVARGPGDAKRNRTIYADTANPEFGKYSRDFGMSDFQADPGYAFRLSEGLKGLDASAASRGGLLSGNTLRAITNYGQDAASQEYTNAFNRYQVNRRNRLAPLETLFGGAHDSANTLTNAAGALGQAQADAAYNLGNARASGYIGQGNAMSGMVGGLANALGGFNYGGGLYGFGGSSKLNSQGTGGY